MGKIIEYPRGSFKNGLEIAAAVDYLGGSCSIISCAERLSKKVSGAFKDLISSAVKHNLITSKKEVLSTTELFRVYKLAYDETEKLETLRKSFLAPQLYKNIYERFRGKELPVSMLDKLLIREFGVDDRFGSRASGYFVDGVKSLKMLENGKLIDNVDSNSDDNGNIEILESETDDNSASVIDNLPVELKKETIQIPMSSNTASYSVMIVGPGMNTKIEINEEDDLYILDAMINKIKRKFKEGSE